MPGTARWQTVVDSVHIFVLVSQKLELSRKKEMTQRHSQSLLTKFSTCSKNKEVGMIREK
jgi:hypothetical protein